jgi:hypothetical protein
MPNTYRSFILKFTGGIVIFIVLYMLGSFIPTGFDWQVFFGAGRAPSFFVPWVHWILPFLNWSLVVALTLIALGWATWQRKGSLPTLFFVLTSLPTMWTLFLGQLDGLALLGLLIMPLGAPLALLKPQLTTFAMLKNRQWFIAAAILGIISVVIWGGWPLNLIARAGSEWKEIQPQDISLFPWSIPFVLPMLWLSRGDEDMLMSAGSLVTPLLVPYHFIVILPGLARLSLGWQFALWILSWMPLSANWIGPIGWRFGNVFSLILWFALWTQKRKHGPNPQSDPSDQRDAPTDLPA